MTALKRHLNGTTSLTEVDPLKADFRNFLWMIWKSGIIDGDPDPTAIQYDIAQFLQYGPRRLVIEAFRGVGKSWITAAYVLWLLYCDPQKKIMIVSASKNRADSFSTFLLLLINQIAMLRFLRPREEQRNSKIEFDVGPATPDQSPSVKSVGITGQLTGSRADEIVADDIEVPNNSDTEGKRMKLSELVKEFDAVLKPGGKVKFLGTPQTEQSVYNELANRGYVIRIWPARYPTAEKRERYGARLAPMIGEALDANSALELQPTEPTRFDDEDLLERELSYGRSGFALQFQLDTTLSDADRYPLKLRDLIVLPLDPLKGPSDMAWASSPDLRVEVPTVGLNGDFFYQPAFVSKEYNEYELSVMFVDPSGRGKDETSYAIIKMLHGRLFLMDYGAFLGGYEEPTLLAILAAAKRFKVNLILCEPNYGGGMFTQMLRALGQKHYTCQIEDAEWANTQKELRIIDTLEPVMNQHRLVVDQALILKDYNSVDGYPTETAAKYRLFFQMSRITKDRGALAHDDRIESVAGAVAYCVEYMNRDTDKAHADAREKEIDEELEKFMNGVFAGSFKKTEEAGIGGCRVSR